MTVTAAAAEGGMEGQPLDPGRPSAQGRERAVAATLPTPQVLPSELGVGGLCRRCQLWAAEEDGDDVRSASSGAADSDSDSPSSSESEASGPEDIEGEEQKDEEDEKDEEDS